MHLHKLPVPGYFVIKYRIITAYSNALNSDILRVTDIFKFVPSKEYKR